MEIKRRKTRVVRIGSVAIGGIHPVAIQSMTKAKTADVQETLSQIKVLKGAGCQIVRLAIRDLEDARALKKIKPFAGIPLVADIHFNSRLALEAIENGVDKIRLNPGNIYKVEEIKQIAKACRKRKIPIRVGLNSGSLPKLETKSSRLKSTPERMVKSALDYLKILESAGFYNTVISLKASNILDTLENAYWVARVCQAWTSVYLIHLTVTLLL